MFLRPACGGAFWDWPIQVPTDMAVRDLDGDGLADVVTISQMMGESRSDDEGRIEVYRQTAAGTFAPPDAYGVGTYPWRLALGDLNGDGLVDLVVTDADADAAWLLFQDPLNKAHFLPPQLLMGGIRTRGVAIADLNGDGTPDVVLTDGLADRLVLLYGNPALPGAFLPAGTLPMPGNPSLVAAGDLNGDGLADLAIWVDPAIPGPETRQLVVGFQLTGGGFGPLSILASSPGQNGKLLSVIDYDGDGRGDLIACLTPGLTDSGPQFKVFLQSTVPGTFGPPVDTPINGIRGIQSVAVADLNGDGRPDAVVAGTLPTDNPNDKPVDGVAVFLQSGGGAFIKDRNYRVSRFIDLVAVGDVDGDGLNDLVLYAEKHRIKVMIQSPLTPGTFAHGYPIP
jgi:hypothetical protein